MAQIPSPQDDLSTTHASASKNGQPTVFAERAHFAARPQEAPGSDLEDGQLLPCPKELLVVGIGASAGGLEALEAFFDHTQPDDSLAYVVVQHLSPDFKSLMDELLSRHTDLTIHRVEDGMKVEANSIYLIPPRKEMIISGGRLLLTDKDSTQSLSMPIDTFFRSLAQDCANCSVGIILSGTGSDGSRGIVAIHEAGGLVLAQDTETAKFDGMPRAAVETGVVDLVLPPAEMPAMLARYLKRPRADKGHLHTTQEDAARDGFQLIFRRLREDYGIDFSNYKPTTVERRIDRRLLINQSVDLESYARRVAEDPCELDALYKDLLIGVTRFFRDPEAFEVLEREVLPSLLAKLPPGEELRVWVSACATGEEAYSLAMLLHEALAAAGNRHTAKIFATDVHRSSLEIASVGIYSGESLVNVTETRLQKFFVQHGERFHVSPELRKLIVFAPHNVIRDAPFTRLDLITCRNMLIYLQPAAQKKVLSLFHFGLKTGGVLFLGPSETPGELSDEFETIHPHWRIYSKRRDVRLANEVRLPATMGFLPSKLPGGGVVNQQAMLNLNMLRVYDTLLDEFVPAGVLLNDRREILHSFAGASQFLRYRDGRPTLDILDLVDTEIRLALSGAIHRALATLQPVRYTGIRTQVEGQSREITLAVRPIAGRNGDAPHLLITFENEQRFLPTKADAETYQLEQVSRERVRSLETELQYTRENLQATLEEMETSNEELQATNEELIASNEELQSTNEELHSVNEELYTVNAEYQRKIAELTEITDDLDNLFNNLEEGVAFLDRDLCLRKFTPQLAKVFQLQPQDIGRRIDNFANRIGHERLTADLLRVIETEQPFEADVKHGEGKHYLLRIAPYRSRTRVEGAVLKLLDITRLKDSEQKLRFLSKVFMDGADPIILEDLNGQILDVNAEAERAYGYSREELLGKNKDLLHPDALRGQSRALRERILAGETVRNIESMRRAKDGSTQAVLNSLSLLTDDAGKPVAVASFAKNISDLKTIERDSRRLAGELTSSNRTLQDTVERLRQAEGVAQEAVRRRDEFLAMLSHELRNPLSAVLAATQVLERAPENTQLMQAAGQIIQRQAEQMARLLDDLLDVARVVKGKIELNSEPLDLTALVPELLQAVQPAVAARDHHIEVVTPPEPLWVRGDRTRLLQIQMNLLSNAAKYTPPHGKLQLILERDGDDAVIRVRDNGLGIPPSMLEKIFELFVQADDTLHRADGGMGVGLTLVRILVDLHGGKVSAQSAGSGQGSEFVVRLPCLQELPTAANEDPHESPTAANTLRILVVEDNTDSRDMLGALLQLDGHTVQTAADGNQGLAALLQEKFDVALVDVGLPGISGYEVARQICQRHDQRPGLLVALTGYGREDDRKAVLAAGFDVHLIKPCSRGDLVGVLAKAAKQ